MDCKSLIAMPPNGPAAPKRRELGSDGQVLLMVAIMAMMLAAAALAVIPVGQTITGKIQAQNAADAAATACVTYLARGSNLLENTNGIHWDFDVLMIQAIIGVAGYYDAKIASDCDDWYDAFGPCEYASIYYPIEGHKKIDKMEKIQHDAYEGIKAFQEGVDYAIPILAFAYASFLAGENGADPISLDDIPILDKIPGVDDLQDVINDTLGELDITPYTWIVSPSVDPLSSMKIAEKKTADSSWDSPLCTDSVMPFLPCLFPFFNDVNWEEDYYVSSDNVGKTYTFVVTRNARKAPGLLNSYLAVYTPPAKPKKKGGSDADADGDSQAGAVPVYGLFGSSEDYGASGDGEDDDDEKPKQAEAPPLIPPICAVGSAKYYGDKITIAGNGGDNTYLCLPGFALSIDPFSEIRFFEQDYHAKFKQEMQPVKFQGTMKGKDILIFH